MDEEHDIESLLMDHTQAGYYLLDQAETADLFDADLVARYLGEPGELPDAAYVPFAEWAAVDAELAGQSLVAHLLADDAEDAPTGAMRALLEARRDTPPTLCRVGEMQDDGAWALVDLHGGEEVHATLDELAGVPDPAGHLLVARLLEVGGLCLATPLGPALPGSAESEVMGRIPDRATLHAEPHRAGALWSLVEEARSDDDDPFYEGWIDEPMPRLGGKSPRQAAKGGEEERRAVLSLVRTLPDMPSMQGGMSAAPRRRLLRELGL